MYAAYLFILWTLLCWEAGVGSCLMTFEKVANVLYTETPISTQSPVTLSLCVRSCLNDENCRAVSFAVPSLSCSQFNSTASDASLISRPNTYYLEKVLFPRIDGVIADACSRRLWALERFPQKAVVYSDSPTNSLVKVIDGIPFRTRCSGLCLQEIDFVCQASQYNFTTKQCTLLTNDRRKDLRQFQDAPGVDYTENLCVPSAQRCANSYTFERYQDIVFPPFYFDKTLPAGTAASCSRLCLNEPEFVCRSYLYQAASQDCILSHNDRLSTPQAILPTLPRIYAALLGRPLTEYYEFACLPEGRKCLTFSGLTRYSTFEMDRSFQLNDPVSLQQCEEFCLGDQTSSCSYLTYLSSNSTCIIAPVIKPANGRPSGMVGVGDYLQNTCRGGQLVSASANYKTASDTTGYMNSRAQRQPTPGDQSDAGMSSGSGIASSTRSSSNSSSQTVSNTSRYSGISVSGSAQSSGNSSRHSDNGNNTSLAASAQNLSAVTNASQGGTVLPMTSSMVLATQTSQQPANTTLSSVLTTTLLDNLNQSHGVNPNTTDQRISSGWLDQGAGCRFTRTNGQIISAYVTATVQDVELDACELLCEASNSCLSFSYSPKQRLCLLSGENLGKSPKMINSTSDSDSSFYEKGTECTDIRFECNDSQIVIKINMERPFRGRLFVEGSQAPECSARFPGQTSFQWAVPLSAEPCGTVYTGNGHFVNTITLQHHEVLVTKNDRRYQINCKYDIGTLNVSSRALSVMSPALTNITMVTMPPSLTIDITDLQGNALQTAVLGDSLLFSIVVPDNGPYGIAAKNCYAFGTQENERMQLTDDTGCPVLPEFFRPFQLRGKSLQAEFDAFRFRNSYVITYQCTVNYCLDVCPQPICDSANSTTHTRRKREDNVIGAYNLRRQLQIDDSTEAVNDSSLIPGKVGISQGVCLTNSVVITLAVFTGVFFMLDVVLLLVAIRLRRRQQQKMRNSIVTANH